MATTSEYTEHQHPPKERIEELTLVKGRFYSDEESREVASFILCPQCLAVYRGDGKPPPRRPLLSLRGVRLPPGRDRPL